jgi:hypothetical protein
MLTFFTKKMLAFFLGWGLIQITALLVAVALGSSGSPSAGSGAENH